MQRAYKFYDLLMALFVTVLLLSNLLSSAKLIDLGVSVLGLRLSFDAGTLVFPIAYIFGDVLTEVYGYKRARRVIWAGFGASVLMALFVAIAARLPGEASWSAGVGQEAYDAILGGIPFLIVASLVAYLAGSFSNSYVMARMKILTKGRWLPTRTIGSTLIGQGIDTVLFVVLATLLAVFPPEAMISLIVTNYILKVGTEIILTPVTIYAVNAIKRVENEDVYDYDTAFTPFRLDV